MGVVVFDAVEFKESYPEFKNDSEAFLTRCFQSAALMINNTSCSIVKDLDKRKFLLYLLTAHFAIILNPENGLTGGVLNGATEGTVSVSFNTSWVTKENQLLSQTVYGQQVLAATKPYRSSLVIGAIQARQARGVRYGS